jgi:hypothetical protein
MNRHTIIVAPHIRPDGTRHPNAFDARLDGELVCTSETPFFDGARILLKTGKASPDDVLVMRHTGSDHDALRARVGYAAGLTIEETGFGPKRRKYKPRPTLEGPPRIEGTSPLVPEPPPAPALAGDASEALRAASADDCGEAGRALAATR